MPRKTKEQTELENVEKTVVKKSATKSVAKKSTSSKNGKTASEKKATTSSTKKASTASSKKTTTTKSSSKTTKPSASSNSVKNKTTSSRTKKSTTSKNSTKSKKAKSSDLANIQVVEYYDLPYRYNQTVVKVLAQTPTNLFIYWDISDDDRENFKLKYGNNFFEATKPVLIIHNDTLGYSFEVDINDFANSWYLHVNDSKCNYRIELGRRPIQYNPQINADYIYVSASNEIESPNDKILFNKNQNMVYFRDVKTNKDTSIPVSNLTFIRNMGKIYNIYDFYKAIYKDENIEEIYDLSNPSSR